MPDEHLAAYLHDHLAGSVVAIELLEHLEKARGGTDLAPFFATLRQDILADRAELDALIGRVGGSTGTVRAAVGWLGEKAARLKLRMDDASGGDLRLLEATELVAVGIEGKHYEMAGYGCVRTFANLLGYEDAAALLQETLDEEGEADKKLTELAETIINVEAEAADGEGADEEEAPAPHNGKAGPKAGDEK